MFILDNGSSMNKKIIGVVLLSCVIGSSYAQVPNLPPFNPPEPPPGNYSESCGSATGNYFYPLIGTTLQMYCVTNIAIRPGVSHYTSVSSSLPNATNCRYVENINGVLTCTGGWK